MKLGRIINEITVLVEVEGGVEVGGQGRLEKELYADGYKKACLTERPSETATETWVEYPTCLVQEWLEEEIPEENPKD